MRRSTVRPRHLVFSLLAHGLILAALTAFQPPRFPAPVRKKIVAVELRSAGRSRARLRAVPPRGAGRVPLGKLGLGQAGIPSSERWPADERHRAVLIILVHAILTGGYVVIRSDHSITGE